MLTLARAATTLQDGGLITKGEALGVLAELGAPTDVVDDIRRRRYGTPRPADQQWIARRAERTLAVLGPAIDQVVAAALGGRRPTLLPPP